MSENEMLNAEAVDKVAETYQEIPQPEGGFVDIDIDENVLFEGQQAFLKNLAETFDDEMKADYERIVTNYEAYTKEFAEEVDKYVDVYILNKGKVPEEVKEPVYDDNHEDVRAFIQIAELIKFLHANEKLDEAFMERCEAIDLSILKSRMRLNAVQILPADQEEEMVANMDYQLSYATLMLFSFQSEQTLKSLMNLLVEDSLTADMAESYRETYDNIYHVTANFLKFHNVLTNHLSVCYDATIEIFESIKNKSNRI